MSRIHALPDASQDSVEFTLICLVVTMIALALGVAISPWWFLLLLFAGALMLAAANLS